jgi:hypothetical protein
MNPEPRSARWIEGFQEAEKEFFASETPAFINPYHPEDPASDGYEEAVYIFTQK